MKAEITENGYLVVTPENPTETFALSVWWDRHKKSDNTENPVGLRVNLKEPILFDEGLTMRTNNRNPTVPKPQIIPKGQGVPHNN